MNIFMSRLLKFLFGCGHRRTTFPMTREKKQTYVVCLACGKEFAYDWDEMRLSA